MTIAALSVGEGSLAQITSQGSNKKTPPKRTATAVADQKLAPEPR